jgi:Tol biopolymer transport system component
MRIPAVAVLASFLLFLGLAAPAGANFPGRNGRIYFSAPARGDVATGCGVASLSSKGTGYECVDYFRSDPAVSPDRKLIAATGGAEPTSIYVMRINGRGVRRLTSPSEGSTLDLAPAFSPDGGHIVWGRADSSNDGVFLMNADGSGQHQLTSSGLDPVFSPSGAQLAYGGDGIRVSNANGSGSRRLVANRSQRSVSGGVVTNYVEYNREPNWSPDGRRIVFTRESHTTKFACTPSCSESRSDAADVFVMNADGSGLRQLTSAPGIDEEDPQFSPDGRSIVYYHLRHGDDDFLGQIWVMRADGSAKHKIANGANPEWSSVGRKLRKPRLKFRYQRISRHGRCLHRLDGYSFAVKTKASRKTRFDISTYMDGRLLDQEFNSRGFGNGVDLLRKGRHKLRIVVTDPAVHDRISRTFKFRRC